MKNLIYLMFFLTLVACSQERSSSDYAKSILKEKDYAANSGYNGSAVESRAAVFEDNLAVEPPRTTGAPPAPPSGISVRTPAIPREVIKKADYKLEVADLENSTSIVHQLAESHSAFVSGMNLNSSAKMVNNVMTLRVPNASFESLLEAISEQAIFTNHKKIHSQDVTEQFVDIQSRLKVKKEIKSKYERMLRDDAKSLSEIFNAEEKIRVLQEEIEAKEGKLRYLADRVDLSEIKLELYQQVEYKNKLLVQNKSFFQKSKDSFLKGWGAVQVVILSGLNVWPMMFLFGLVWVKRESWISRIKKKMLKEESE